MLRELGKTLLRIGSSLLLLGGLLWFGGKLFPLGRLPGDILLQSKGFIFYWPLTTSLLLSLGLSALLAKSPLLGI